MIRLTSTLTLVCLSTYLWAQAPEAAPAAALPTKPTKSSPKKLPVSVRAKRTTISREVPDTYKGRVILVGSGGGVTGRETTYSLLDDGRLFSRKTGEKSYTYVGKQTAANTKKVFWSVEDRCKIKKTTYRNPGNTYRFVGWRKGVETYRVTWAPGDTVVPPNYEQVYKGFIGMLPKK